MAFVLQPLSKTLSRTRALRTEAQAAVDCNGRPFDSNKLECRHGMIKGLFGLLPRLWGWMTDIFQLSGFYCILSWSGLCLLVLALDVNPKLRPSVYTRTLSCMWLVVKIMVPFWVLV